MGFTNWFSVKWYFIYEDNSFKYAEKSKCTVTPLHCICMSDISYIKPEIHRKVKTNTVTSLELYIRTDLDSVFSDDIISMSMHFLSAL